MFISGALDEMALTLPEEAVDAIAQNYAVNVNFFGVDMQSWFSVLMLFASIIFFALLMIVLSPVMAKIRRRQGGHIKKRAKN